ncbi:MAG: isoprenylcysteine carboxylmethyltransferase family protein [Saprospiraceae bacterium]|nr:isoprenylcysteine carboxylmethyltransferase family protein [Saprospiraceae bacterium]
MKNLRLTLLYLFTGYIIPLLPRMDALGCYKVWLLMLSCIVMLAWANPEITITEGLQNASNDRGTVMWIFLMGYIAMIAPIIEWGYFIKSCTWTNFTTLGLLMIIGGLAYRIYAITALGRQFTGVVKQISGHHLVVTGPYTRVRHPSYLGSIFAFSGCAVTLEAWIGLVICFTSMVFAYALRISAEEKLLETIFGDEYRSYQSRTWRMLPYVW